MPSFQWISLRRASRIRPPSATTVKELRPGIQVVEASPGDDNDVSYGGSRSRMDVSRLRDDIGFTAEYDLAAGLGAYLQWREEYGFQD